jgi:hypothetical protein
MKTLVSLFMTVIFAVGAVGQGLSVAESSKKPGDIIRYTIKFEKPLGEDVQLIDLGFNLITERHEDQKGQPEQFDLTNLIPKSPTEYEVEGAIPNVMSGTYLLRSVQVRTKGGAVRNYSYPTDFAQENRVRVESGTKDIFPNIKSVTPSH